ncbi:MAG: D-Ala-D-Ala carboxypeptidase family metallohydrolase [Gemmatimonadota bacterium]
MRAPAGTSRLGPTLVLSALALGSLAILARADASLGPGGSSDLIRRPFPTVTAAPSAMGKSRGVRMQTALPGEKISLPLETAGAPEELRYQWIKLGELMPAEQARPLVGALYAPSEPGFYRLAVTRGLERQVVDSAMIGVLTPLAAKRGITLDGYRIGMYRGERNGRTGALPLGFLRIDQDEAGIAVSEHLTLGDFITHDDQKQWPRYVALSPRLLDKLELVFNEIARWRGREDAGTVAVKSGFRTPLHNTRVRRAASDSRHQYGDAADISVDANGDGRITSVDASLIARAVEIVEKRHPDLVGGLGVYTRTNTPYAHVDVRGTRVRWRG